jgi:UDP-N-acetylmuramoyl-L-alanyl-D-glutamate--2,6-diaminopimelate ligase
MLLAELAKDVPGAKVEAGARYDVRAVVQDSRRAGPGDLFVAVRGLTVDGHDYSAEAARRGAAVAIERDVGLPPGTAVVRLRDTRAGLARLASAFHGHPSRKLRVAGVTGTDGKTTVAHMAARVLELGGRRSGLMSTVAFRAGGDEAENRTGQTTTEAPEVQAWLARMAGIGVEDAIIEVTSHALVQERVAAVDFDVAAITNVRHDHLDYHARWEDYVEAKAGLLDLCARAYLKDVEKTGILNRDDAAFARLAGHPTPRRWTFSLVEPADLAAREVVTDDRGSWFRLSTSLGEAPVRLRMPGRFNVENAVCAAAICLALGLDLESTVRGLEAFEGVPGRLERIDLGQPFAVYVDFAHSAGALGSVLAELRPLTRGRLIAVFGSTARSDHDRPGMGRAAERGADYFVITTDDPVDEDPAEIASDVASGVEAGRPGRDYEIVLDRPAAIRRAIELARPGDTILLAGKGHERTMVTAAGREPWDERAEAEAAIRARVAV